MFQQYIVVKAPGTEEWKPYRADMTFFVSDSHKDNSGSDIKLGTDGHNTARGKPIVKISRLLIAFPARLRKKNNSNEYTVWLADLNCLTNDSSEPGGCVPLISGIDKNSQPFVVKGVRIKPGTFQHDINQTQFNQLKDDLDLLKDWLESHCGIIRKEFESQQAQTIQDVEKEGEKLFEIEDSAIQKGWGMLFYRIQQLYQEFDAVFDIPDLYDLFQEYNRQREDGKVTARFDVLLANLSRYLKSKNIETSTEFSLDEFIEEVDSELSKEGSIYQAASEDYFLDIVEKRPPQINENGFAIVKAKQNHVMLAPSSYLQDCTKIILLGKVEIPKTGPKTKQLKRSNTEREKKYQDLLDLLIAENAKRRRRFDREKR